MLRPWPSAPVLASTPGTLLASGWPPRMPSAAQNAVEFRVPGRSPCPRESRRARGSRGPCSGCSGRDRATSGSRGRSAARRRRARAGCRCTRTPSRRGRAARRGACAPRRGEDVASAHRVAGSGGHGVASLHDSAESARGVKPDRLPESASQRVSRPSGAFQRVPGGAARAASTESLRPAADSRPPGPHAGRSVPATGPEGRPRRVREPRDRRLARAASYTPGQSR